MWACRLTQRTDFSYEKYRWQPRDCDMPEFEGAEFLRKEKGLLAVVKGCSWLKALKLQCLSVTDEALQAIGIYCLSLESLALYNFQRFTDSAKVPPSPRSFACSTMKTYLINTREVSAHIMRLSVPNRSSFVRFVRRVEEKTLTGEVPKSP